MGESLFTPRSPVSVEEKVPLTKRVSVTVGTTSGADVAITWDTPFKTTDYTVVASILQDGVGDNLRVLRVRSKTTTGCVVHVWNNALAARTGEVQAIAIPD